MKPNITPRSPLAAACHGSGPSSCSVVLGIGSNCGDKDARVQKALDWLKTLLQDCRTSHIYATPEWSGAPQIYHNAVMTGTYRGSEASLDLLLKDYELSQGRNRQARAEGRVPIDIDIVMCDGRVVRPDDWQRDFFKIGFKAIFPEA